MQVELTDGSVYTGLLASIGTRCGLPSGQLVLRAARLLRAGSTQPSAPGVGEAVTLAPDSIAQVLGACSRLRLPRGTCLRASPHPAHRDPPHRPPFPRRAAQELDLDVAHSRVASDTFETDGEVSRAHQAGRKRELQPATAWLADASSSGASLELEVRGSGDLRWGGGGRGGQPSPKPGASPHAPLPHTSAQRPRGRGRRGGQWDQFHANESKFGVRARYNEQEYTTDFRADEFSPTERARAARLAREIEGKRTGNRHSAEERNQRGRRRGEGPEPDEEELYSGVSRATSSPAASYVPPHRREASAPSHDERSKTNDGASPPDAPAAAAAKAHVPAHTHALARTCDPCGCRASTQKRARPS